MDLSTLQLFSKHLQSSMALLTTLAAPNSPQANGAVERAVHAYHQRTP